MGVKYERLGGPGSLDFAINNRRGVGDSQQLRGNSTTFQHGLYKLCVPFYIGQITGNIGDFEEFRELGKDSRFVLFAPTAGSPTGVRLTVTTKRQTKARGDFPKISTL